LEELFKQLKEVGTTTIFAEHLNTSPYILKRIEPLLAKSDAEVRAVYAAARNAEHRHALGEMVMALIEKYGFDIRLGRVLDHSRDKKMAQG
jgi:hypothetical protein